MTTPFIVNYPRASINEQTVCCDWQDVTSRILIRIHDFWDGSEYSLLDTHAGKYFHIVYNFHFNDTDNDDKGITKEQAVHIAAILEESLKHGRDVFVHCTAGICRSGAVVECGVVLGFKDTGKRRQPNVRVKTMILKEMGFYAYE